MYIKVRVTYGYVIPPFFIWPLFLYLEILSIYINCLYMC
jgi:hypothetical protein